MKVSVEIARMFSVLLLTVVFVALLWQLPWFLAAILLVPLAVAWWFWPHPSTALSYLVGAIFGTLLSAWSYISVVEAPSGFPLAFLWLPLVWGPAGVLIKRVEKVIVELWSRRQHKKFDLPEFKK